jgi:hypothetical protein
MPRKPSAPSVKSDSGPDEFLDLRDDEGSIFMADATSSGSTSDLEKDGKDRDDNEEGEVDEGGGDGDGDGEVDEGTSLLPSRRATYGGISLKKSIEDFITNGKSMPSIIYASPARPRLPSPATSNTQTSTSQIT